MSESSLKMNGHPPKPSPNLSLSRRQSMQKRLSSWKRSLSIHRVTDQASTASENQTIFQGFEWYTKSTPENSHWRRLTLMVPYLKSIGVSQIWVPPGSKAISLKGAGYDVYDLYDLGEFDQKTGRPTKWGSRAELEELCSVAQSHGIGIIWDAVLNHKAGADATEDVLAVKCDPEDRRKEISAPNMIQAWTSFDFPGRGTTYSSKRWTADDFTGIDYDANTHKPGVYKFLGPNNRGWAKDVDTERGNYDYLMFADIDHSSPSVRQDLFDWSTWLTTNALPNIKGMRLDAIKHYSQAFQIDLVRHLSDTLGKDFFIVGEYWSGNQLTLSNVIGKFKGRISLYDVQLVYNFSDFSRTSSPAHPYTPSTTSPVKNDLRRIFADTLLEVHPRRSVTFVTNHDTQESQSLEAVVEPWFVPHAYALILLRQEGQPSVFYGDLVGNSGPFPRRPAAGGRLPRLLAARRRYAYGKQKDYFDQADCVGWTRLGQPGHADGLAVLVNASWESRTKRMLVGSAHRGEVWTDVMGWAWGEVTIDEFGQGNFPVAARGVSVWAPKNARGRAEIERLPSAEEVLGGGGTVVTGVTRSGSVSETGAATSTSKKSEKRKSWVGF